MAVAQIRPDWTVGTLTLTSGSKNFTTTGSALQTAAIQAGDEIITRSGLVLIVASITGQNAGTLMENCPAGAAGAAQSLRIRYQPDGSRYNGAVADMVNLLGSGNVYALAELVTAADKLGYFTGAGTAALTDLTALGRSLIGAATQAAAYTALGNVPDGQLPNRLRVTNYATVTDCNTVSESGWYNVANDAVGNPESATMILFHLAFSPTQARQIIMRHSSNSMYERRSLSGVWGPWYIVWSGANILSPVSQSGGVPTGGVIQRGSNANGEFVRLADGTQHCWIAGLASSASTAFTLAATWTLPAAFSTAFPIAGFVSLQSNAGNPAGALHGLPYFNSGASSVAAGFTSAGEFTPGISVSLRIIATGRWF